MSPGRTIGGYLGANAGCRRPERCGPPRAASASLNRVCYF
jgi:hypothetical protein